MQYPDAVNLPFNGAAIQESFQPASPGALDPGGDGFWIMIQRNGMVVSGAPEARLPEGEFPSWAVSREQSVYLGTWLGRPLRVVRLEAAAVVPAPFAVEPFNVAEERLDDRLLTLGGLGQQILFWQRQSAHCSRCGNVTVPINGTWGKKCTHCSAEHFPHIHPCVIVLIRRGDSFLLARKPEWPAGRYSLVAGFLDFGESLEECVQREVREEVGVEVANLRYVGSQNWPFPSQLMAGFVADYAGGTVEVDRKEIEDARWFSPDSLPDSLPGKRSIARWIIDRFALKL